MVEVQTGAEWWLQLVWLFVLALPVATISWTVTHEELFREPREICVRRAQASRRLWARKFFYLLTCEYCFSHYVALFFLAVTRYRLLLDGWRGYLIAFFALVAVANFYMSAFARLRQEVKAEGLEAKRREKVLEEEERQLPRPDGADASGPPRGEEAAQPAPALRR